VLLSFFRVLPPFTGRSVGRPNDKRQLTRKQPPAA
jgi:hypothetical protein